MAREILYKSSVNRDLGRIDPKQAARIVSEIRDALGGNPSSGERLTGEFKGLFKQRIGGYRVTYARAKHGVVMAQKWASRQSL